MNTKGKKKLIISIALKLAVTFSVLAGLFTTFFDKSGFMNSSAMLYFTIQSNIWIGGICLAFAIIQIVSLVKGRNLLPNWLYILKFMFTTSITLTFMVMTCMLTPNLIMTGQAAYLASANNVLCHYLAPILAIIDFILFDTEWKNKLVDSCFAAIMPIYYLIFALILGSKGVVFNSNGDTYPYFFMDYKGMGWFNGANPNGKYGALTFGVFWWIIILTIFVLLMGLGFIAINRKMKKSKLHQIPFFEQEAQENTETEETAETIYSE